MAGMDLPVRAIREQIASAIDMVIHQARLKDGSRKITHITEVQGMEGDTIILQDIFVLNEKGTFTATGIRPKFMEKLANTRVSLPNNLFNQV